MIFLADRGFVYGPLLLLVAGCSGAIANASSSDAGELDGTTRDGSSNGDAGVDCPSDVPANGSTCPPGTPAVCEYGGGAQGTCTTRATCEGGRWVVTSPPDGCGANAGCPATYAARALGTPCAPDTSAQACNYDEGRCHCGRCTSPDGGAAGVWTCGTWSVVDGCPAPRPLLGAACDVEGATCGDLCQCGGGPSVAGQVCQSGRWVPYSAGGCACGAGICPQ